MLDTTILGQKGESLTVDYLAKQGFAILTTNYRTKRGEVDVIAKKGDVIVFVEVKTRLKKYFPISQVVTTAKQRRIALAAQDFALKNKLMNNVLRFDVATIEYTGQTPEITYIPNAFQYQSR
jgi:putative endonuclease